MIANIAIAVTTIAYMNKAKMLSPGPNISWNKTFTASFQAKAAAKPMALISKVSVLTKNSF